MREKNPLYKAGLEVIGRRRKRTRRMLKQKQGILSMLTTTTINDLAAYSSKRRAFQLFSYFGFCHRLC